MSGFIGGLKKLKKIKETYETNSYFFVPIYGLTRGLGYKETIKFLQESEAWSSEQMCNWQLGQIQEIVDYAMKHVPFYRELYKAAGIQSGYDIKSFEDFSKLPFVTKADIKANHDAFISDEAGLKYREFCTSGTQMPLNFYLDEWFNGREQAFYKYYWEKEANYKVGIDKCIILRGGGKGNEHFKYNKIYNYKIFDSDYAGSSEHLLEYDYEIKKFGAKYAQAYPSSIYRLALNYKNHPEVQPPHFETVFLASENVYPHQVNVIKQVFSVNKILYGYGHSEQVLLGVKYSDSDEYGFLPQYGYCELINTIGNDAVPGEMGEIVGTSWSKIMPFIRYRTNDFGVKGEYNGKDYLSNAFPVKAIVGRQQEFVIRNDNIPVSIVSICGEHMPEMGFFKEMQFEQFAPGELQINVVLYNKQDLEKYSSQIINVMERKFENHVTCSVKEVERIQKTAAGKNIMLIQHININLGDF